MLENALQIIVGRGLLDRVADVFQYGETRNEQLLSIGLQLCTTWLNRILFIKLLEGQLIKYNKNSELQSFLSSARVKDYQDLEELFFDVLAVEIDERSEDIRKRFPIVPYLNSSLFEPTELERQTISISGLKNNLRLPLYRGTILRKENAKKATGELPLAEYLLKFLESYDFSAVAAQAVLDENKPIINASVLGLIFEKINNYQDGAFFTPAAITSYMCRNTVRRAVVQKFNEEFGWGCTSLIDVYNTITPANFAAAENVVSSVRICDPAVGSGHFLVAALNELVSVKHELGLLRLPGGKLFKGQISTEGDELIVLDENGDVFEYDRRLPQSQQLQELLFAQKRLLIENCLFGVDINPTSAHICRLRLWIELLKASYYKGGKSSIELETLPNIDINIKTGNSLVSRFRLDAELSSAIKKKTIKAANMSIDSYRQAIHDYTHAKSKEKKRTLAEFIENIKRNFREEIKRNDRDVVRMLAAGDELRTLVNQSVLFSGNAGEEQAKIRRIEKLELEIERLQAKLDAIEKAEIFQHAFEWRFEFPEVLDDRGNFKGFDAVIGNPPYGVKVAQAIRDRLQRDLGKVPDHEIYYWFILLASLLLKTRGELSYIIPNTILFNVFAKGFRRTLLEDWDIVELVDCTEYPVFSDATVRNVIISLAKGSASEIVHHRDISSAESLKDVLDSPIVEKRKVDLLRLNTNWSLALKLPPATIAVLDAIQAGSTPLCEYFPQTSQGLIAYDRYQGQDDHTIKNRIFHSSVPSSSHDKRWLRGEDVRRYECKWNGEDYFDYSDKVANRRQPKYFQGLRLLIREITNPGILAAITDEEAYNDPSILVVLDNPDSRFSLYALLGIMNSQLATFFHFNSSPKASKGVFPKILITDVNSFPLPSCDSAELSVIANLAKEISTRRKNGLSDGLFALESQLDTLVCDCYGLRQEQRSLVLRRTAPMNEGLGTAMIN